ncbi:MAG: hypothetical protein ACD_36C00056G0001, partial [uncultured bacterium]
MDGEPTSAPISSAPSISPKGKKAGWKLILLGVLLLAALSLGGTAVYQAIRGAQPTPTPTPAPTPTPEPTP